MYSDFESFTPKRHESHGALIQTTTDVQLYIAYPRTASLSEKEKLKKMYEKLSVEKIMNSSIAIINKGLNAIF